MLREVGTTNRTHIDDYRAAINDAHAPAAARPSQQFPHDGFTARPELRELAALGRERGIPGLRGPGQRLRRRPARVRHRRTAGRRRACEAGVDLVSFSGDKLLGGPQAGILAGKPDLVARLRRNPLFRALRLDKLITQALENTLRDVLLERWDERSRAAR